MLLKLAVDFNDNFDLFERYVDLFEWLPFWYCWLSDYNIIALMWKDSSHKCILHVQMITRQFLCSTLEQEFVMRVGPF